MIRSAGILMPITSLPSEYGIGTMGKAAREFIDFLADAGQTFWQILPEVTSSLSDSTIVLDSTIAIGVTLAHVTIVGAAWFWSR